MTINRRDFIKASAGAVGTAALGNLAGCASVQTGSAGPKVVVVGAGFGGATFARYLKLWAPQAQITVIEPNTKFVSCPFSNTVLAGVNQMEDITMPYDYLKQAVDNFVPDTVTAIDTAKQTVTTAGGKTFAYDKLVLAGGVELLFDKVQGYDAEAQKTIKHAWKASADQTGVLRQQLEAMPDGGTFVMSVPMSPYRCPPGPYERACMVATYFKKAKPKSKVIILDGNPDIASKKPLFLAAWKKHYGYGTDNSMIDYRPNNMPRMVDAKTMIVGTEFDEVKGDVINVVPPMRAATITGIAGVRDGNSGNWCTIDYRTFESKVTKNVHVLGDSTLTNFPKSGSVANNTGKMCAYALSEEFAGRQADPAPVVTNTCYSAGSESTAFHVATVFRWNEEKQSMVPPPNANGISSEESELEMAYMESWARNVWADTLGLPESYNFTAKG
ncbi:MAG: FCSD flavin-binding domain-containing protein [Gallionellaceae bacterium]|nr:FCSD flavin-binding domain-containing protein [Gallionellaceae bacterium]